MKKTLLLAAIGMALSTSALATNVISVLDDQKELTITIYNNGLGLIKDTRRVTDELTKAGEITSISFQGVSGGIIPETSLLNGAQVKEQNYSYDLLSHQSMLKAMLGRTIRIYNPVAGEATEGQLLSSNGNRIMIKTTQGEILSVPKDSSHLEYGFLEVPENLSALPTLTMTVYPDKKQDNDWQLTYLTNGMAWKADYVIELNKNEKMNVTSWVTLSNNTAVDYKNAQVNLLAGSVNRAKPPQHQEMMAMSMKSSMDNSIEASDVGDYKMYRLPFKTDVLNNQQKQVKMFNIADAKYTKTYTYTAGQAHYGQTKTPKRKAKVNVEFENTAKSGLGLAMPKGVVRFYERDDAGELQFTGEDRINHTDKGEKLSFRLGEAFGVTIEEVISNETQLRGKHTMRETTLSLINSKNVPVVLSIAQPLHQKMTVVESNTKFEKMPGRGMVFTVVIPAESTKQVIYDIRYRY